MAPDSARPHDDPPSASPAPRRREDAGWWLGLVATVALAATLGVASVVLTVFGLGGVVLAVAAVLVVAGVTIWRRGLLPVAVLAAALTLPGVWAANGELQVGRSRGPLVAEPRSPGEVAQAPYRRGMGPVLVDLRGFRAPAGSTTRIAARADAGRLVVALPTDRCFALDVRFRGDAIGAAGAFALRAVRGVTGDRVPMDVTMGSMGLTLRGSQDSSQRSGRNALAAWNAGETTSPYGLLAFNRWATEAGRYRRPATGQPSAPTLQLELRSTQQIVIRDYPADVDPLAFTFSDRTGMPVGGIAWPEGLEPPTPPDQAVPRSRAYASTERTRRSRAVWVAWENRTIRWATEQAARAAGPCAASDDLRSRGLSFLTQPAAVRTGGRTEQLVGSGDAANRRSRIVQQPVEQAGAMLSVEVDGTGGTQVRGVKRPDRASLASVRG